MGTNRSLVATAAGVVFTSVSLWSTSGQLGAWMQDGQPSRQPEPKNPSPRPSNPTPRPSDPNPRPDSPRPPTDQPPKPGEQDDDRITDDRDDSLLERERQGDRRARNARNGERSTRAFAFQSPDMEGRFNLASRRLVQMEQRMQQSQEELLRRLGEARRLSGPRQTDALFDVIQQMMLDQAELQRYLVQSRSIWTGDIDPADQSGAPDGVEERMPPTNTDPGVNRDQPER